MHLPRPTYANVVATLALVVAMGGTSYAAATVHTSDIANKAVTTPKLADEAVTTAKLAPNSVGSARVADNSLSLSDIKGINMSGAISFSLSAHACGTLNLSVSGAAVGQAAFLTYTNGLPSDIVLAPLRVVSPTLITTLACNQSGVAVQVTGLNVRVVTFG